MYLYNFKGGLVEKLVLILGILIIVGCFIYYAPEKEDSFAIHIGDAEGIEIKNCTFDDSYDPNDPIYQLIPEAPSDWIEKFGDTERTRLIRCLSELRVVVALQGKRLKELEDYIATKEWEYENAGR